MKVNTENTTFTLSNRQLSLDGESLISPLALQIFDYIITFLQGY